MVLDNGQMGIHARQKSIVLALDPGRDKTGFAFVNHDGGLVLSGIFPTSDSMKFFEAVKSDVHMLSSYVTEGTLDELTRVSGADYGRTSQTAECVDNFTEENTHTEHIHANSAGIIDATAFVAVGNGTHSKNFTAQVRANLPCEIVIVDEKNTTLEARRLYWQIHRPRFLMRLIPQGLRVPDRILDDLAAWAIAIRAVKKYRDIFRNKL